MKKIIALLILSVLLSSCVDKNENESKETEIPNSNIEINDDGIKVEFNDNESNMKIVVNEKDDIIEINNNENNIKIENWNIIKKTSTGTNPDDAALESEVNDLLDEFIDSLDSYDK